MKGITSVCGLPELVYPVLISPIDLVTTRTHSLFHRGMDGHYTLARLAELVDKFEKRNIESFDEFCQYTIGLGFLSGEAQEKIFLDPSLNPIKITSNWNNKRWMMAFSKILTEDSMKLGIDIEKSGLPLEWVSLITILEVYFRSGG